MPTHDWFTIRAYGASADVEIAGEIRPGAAKEFLQALPPGARRIALRITSEGGCPDAALVMATGLRGHPARVEVEIPILAASAATLVAMGGDHVAIGRDAAIMLHDPSVVPEQSARPDSRMLRDAAGVLERLKNRMLDVYAWRLKPSRAEVARLMTATTWFDAEGAVRLGLADVIATTASLPMAACLDATALERLGPVPRRFAASLAALSRPGSAPRHESTIELYARREAARVAHLTSIGGRR